MHAHRSQSPALNLAAWGGLFAALLGTGHAAEVPGHAFATGELNGARFAVARPAHWSGELLLYAHGLRPESAPLSASLDLTDATYARLLDEGWIVAATSYRRNGLIVRDAIADLDALRDLIERTDGSPALVLLLGESMGGAIVTLMAEREPGRFHGAVAVGAALHARDASAPLEPTRAPKIPVIFLTNQSELAGPAAYVKAAARAAVPPALWTIARDGHVNVNAAERAAAIAGLVTWCTAGTIERQRDATVLVAATGVSEVEFGNGDARGRVRRVTDGYGNLFTNFTAEDFVRLRIARGDTFLLEVGSRSWPVRYGADYGDVPPGEWVAFLRAEGVMLFAINRGSAAATAGLHSGDPLVIRRAPES